MPKTAKGRYMYKHNSEFKMTMSTRQKLARQERIMFALFKELYKTLAHLQTNM